MQSVLLIYGLRFFAYVMKKNLIVKIVLKPTQVEKLKTKATG